jgi:hypothetical protein
MKRDVMFLWPDIGSSNVLEQIPHDPGNIWTYNALISAISGASRGASRGRRGLGHVPDAM